MSDALGKMRTFVEGFPDFDILGSLEIDWTDEVPNCAGLFPAGMVVGSRTADITGNVAVTNQYNFALYARLPKMGQPDDAGAELNASWVMAFQEWVQAQSVLGLAPAFGDNPRSERIAASNGALYSAGDEGTALYAVQLSVRFEKRYKRS